MPSVDSGGTEDAANWPPANGTAVGKSLLAHIVVPGFSFSLGPRPGRFLFKSPSFVLYTEDRILCTTELSEDSRRYSGKAQDALPTWTEGPKFASCHPACPLACPPCPFYNTEVSHVGLNF